MLSKVLAYIREGGNANISTIARKLDIEEGTVVMLLDQLIKLGYIEKLDEETTEIPDACNSSKCAGCSKLTSCEPLVKAKYRLVK